MVQGHRQIPGQIRIARSRFLQGIAGKTCPLRIMFRQNAHVPVGLNQDQLEGTYFRLYYQFIKHAFGLQYRPPAGPPAALKIFFDEFPETREAATQFKGYILGLKGNPKIRQAGFTIKLEDIAEIRSHDHVLAQCWCFKPSEVEYREEMTKRYN